MSPRVRYLDLDDAGPDAVVVVIDVLRAFTVEPWFFERGARRVLALADADAALSLARTLPGPVTTAGEHGGERLVGFDLGNSPAEVATLHLDDHTIVHRTSAGTQGLAAVADSGLVLAASFVTARATARVAASVGADRVSFVITGASYGRDGDEDLACAELIAARLGGDDPDPTPWLARVAASDAGRNFAPGGPSWADPDDLTMAGEVDRFDHALEAVAADDVDAIEVRVRH